jgi:hypothetical protein
VPVHGQQRPGTDVVNQRYKINPVWHTSLLVHVNDGQGLNFCDTSKCRFKVVNSLDAWNLFISLVYFGQRRIGITTPIHRPRACFSLLANQTQLSQPTSMAQSDQKSPATVLLWQIETVAQGVIACVWIEQLHHLSWCPSTASNGQVPTWWTITSTDLLLITHIVSCVTFCLIFLLQGKVSFYWFGCNINYL